MSSDSAAKSEFSEFSEILTDAIIDENEPLDQVTNQRLSESDHAHSSIPGGIMDQLSLSTASTMMIQGTTGSNSSNEHDAPTVLDTDVNVNAIANVNESDSVPFDINNPHPHVADPVPSVENLVNDHDHAAVREVEALSLDAQAECEDIDEVMDESHAEEVEDVIEQAVAGIEGVEGAGPVETVDGVDTLQELNDTPLPQTTEDFDKKFPADLEMTPASDVPIANPLPHDILFGRGGLTNHHPG